MARQREIKFVFRGERIVFQNGDGSPRVIIADAELVGGDDDGARIALKGEAEDGELREGLTYRGFGYTKPYRNKRTGITEEQFCFDSFVLETPANEESIVAYLQQCKGIGPFTARTMFDKWGSDAVRMLRESPQDVSSAIPRLKIDRAIEASEFLQKFERIERTKMDLLGLLHGRGFPKKTVDKIVTQYGPRAAELIRRNPYRLMEFNGCGFLKADKLYLELGPKPPIQAMKHAAKMKRQALCVWHAIASNGSGDTWHHQNVAKRSLEKNIAGTEVKFERALKLAVRSGMLVERFEMGSRWLAETQKANAEERVARYVTEARQEIHASGDATECLWPDVDSLGLNPVEDRHQIDNLRLATSGLIGVLAGSPGTGKTHCSALLVKAATRLVGKDKICVAAPTGKAAVRVTEAMQKSGLSTINATTIHTLLKVEGSDGEGMTFYYGRGNPLPFEYIFVDESSMLDVSLMASLLAARGPGTRVLFIGDTNQLAPVGHGAPLRDLIAAGVPTGTLTEIRRNSGRIVRACAEIRDSHRITVGNKLDLDNGENLALIECESPEDQIAAIEQIVGQFVRANPRKFDPVWDVQILGPIRKRKSPLGCKSVNPRLQELLNPYGQQAPGNPFRVGDKIINGKNGWLPAVDGFGDDNANAEGKVYVANGEQAEVLQVDTNKTVVRLQNPDRVVLIPRGTQDDAKEGSDDYDRDHGASGQDSDESESTGTGCNWELAPMISGHKSQGSEWPVAIVVLDEAGARVATRNWLYTCISRGKVFCLLIGKRTVLDEMCRRDGLRRKTFLVERIRELCGPREPISVPDSAIYEWPDEAFSELLAGVV